MPYCTWKDYQPIMGKMGVATIHMRVARLGDIPIGSLFLLPDTISNYPPTVCEKVDGERSDNDLFAYYTFGIKRTPEKIPTMTRADTPVIPLCGDYIP
jgi:hypothetical protein